MSAVPDDGSEDVNDFLARIRELGDKRDREDEERTKKLEEDILKGRQERAARRAERARSISPTKDHASPASTMASSTVGSRSVLDTPPTVLSDIMSPTAKQTLDAPSTSQPAREPSKPDPPAQSSLSRSNTLSWQQRPTSRASPSVRSRPLSVAALGNNALRSPSATPEPTNTQETEGTGDALSTHGSTNESSLTSGTSPANNSLTAMLASKDPSWFRQTPDRGKNSAAYRKSEEPETEPVTRSGGVKMPGMSGIGAKEPTRGPNNASSVRGRPLSTMSVIAAESDSLRLDPPGNDVDPVSSRTPAMSPSQGRISPERPSSPTKGIGGFVQSAMLKRSDSVTKRWSAQATGGLSRGNSTIGNRTSRDLGSVFPSEAANPRSLSPTKEPEPIEEIPAERSMEPILKPEVAAKTVKAGDDELRASKSPPPDISTSRPNSPTKDGRRWSPVKSSWLENAINKQESPRTPKPATPTQPAWMAELQKAKAARASIDISGGKPASSNPPSASSSGLRGVRPGSALRSEAVPSVAVDSSAKESMVSVPETGDSGTDEKEVAREDSTGEVKIAEEPNADIPKATTSLNKAVQPKSKPKPETPPKKDFRSNLKQRSNTVEKKEESVAEFKEAFGKLKRAETRNYKAPDTLKENIMRGKTGLNTTSGPQKTQRVDEFKESILARKKDFAAAPSKPLVKNPSQTVEQATPEALAARTNMLDRQNSASNSAKVAAETSRTSETPRPTSVVATTASVMAAGSSQIKNSALAARFNPNLANILARGPPAASPSSPSPERAAESVQSTPSTSGQKGKELTHATKGRARGPKRKPPSTAKTESPTTEPKSQSEVKKVPSTTPRALPAIPPQQTKAEVQQGKQQEFVEDKILSYNQIKADLLGEVGKVESLGVSNDQKSASVSSPLAKTQTEFAVLSTSPVKTRSKPPAPKSSSVRVSSSSIKIPPTSESLSERPKEPLPATVSPDGKATSNGLPSTPAKKTAFDIPAKTFIATQVSNPNPSSPAYQRPESLRQEQDQKPFSSPTVPAKSAAARGLSNSKPTPPLPTSAIDNEARQTVSDFFGTIPSGRTARPNVDASHILTNAAKIPDKIRTLRKQIWGLTSDGKRVPMPAQQDYMLFEECMYVCVHVFGSAAGKHTTEAYLWVGDGVSPSAVDDAQLFARNIAKEAGAAGRLTVLHQGKETGNFFEALGGIVVVRKGVGKDVNSSYMLCGRKHLGQMAFDEVDYHSASLCSGFPFIVATASGTLFLWKGRGSGADELGCARLIAMDLGITGEIVEIDDGQEPTTFWTALKSSSVDETRIEGHWHLKAKKDKYVTRLFSIDDARPRSAGLGALWGRRASTPGSDEPSTQDIHEISPFSQSDLSQDGIYVLDAYFEVYVVLCWRSTTRFAAFRSALYFAQEYAILAASEEDRPFVPAAQVIFSGAGPIYLKTAFRKWDDRRVTTQPVGSTSAGEVTVLPLHAAIAAIME